MQKPAWYWARLKSMSASEIMWRLRSLASEQLDLARMSMGFVPHFNDSGSRHVPGFRVSSSEIGCWTRPASMKGAEIVWHRNLLAAADRIMAHRLSYFDLVEVDHGNPIRWQRDHSSGKEGGLKPIQFIDYRAFHEVGDCKLVWEPNRHHQLVVLARAYRASGKQEYAREIVEQLFSWLDANPFGRGMNWRSPLELGIRLINWVWALDLVLESGVFDDSAWRRITQCVYQHCHDITRKYSQGSSANNHLVGEAAGVFIASSYFQCFPESKKWQEQSAEILEREIIAQTYPDGCTREHAIGIPVLRHPILFIQRYLLAGATGRPFSDEYLRRLGSMVRFIQLLSAAGGSLPMFGDRDDGYVLDLGDEKYDGARLAALAGRELSPFESERRLSKVASEAAFWLYGVRDGTDQIGSPDDGFELLASSAFADSGYYLLQYRDQKSSASVFVDCAELGYGAIAAHGNADALSFVLRVNGNDILVDPGTYDYFTTPEWRNYFRTTRAHNTLELDSIDQSQMLGPFMWGRRANAQCLHWVTGDTGGQFEGTHDGYSSLPVPAVHRRRIELDGANGELDCDGSCAIGSRTPRKTFFPSWS